MTPRFDSSELAVSLVQLSRRIQRTIERRAGEHGTTAVQVQLLHILRDGAPTINELAGRLELDKSSTSGLVNRAQDRGLVRRVASQLDRRSVRVRLTARGRELLDAVSQLVADDITGLLEPLAREDQVALGTALESVLGN